MQLRNTLLLRCRKRTAAIIEMGSAQDWVSRGYDILSGLMLLANLSASILYTFNSMALQYGSLLVAIEAITVAFFAVDYALRLWTAPEFFPKLSSFRSVWKYVFSLTGIVDLLSFLPYYLPIFFPAGAAVFRIFRVVRIFRLFQINAYYSAMNVITEVLRSRRQQLASSVFIILVLMLASSLCMYSLEHEAQPEVFSNAFSGIWWAVSTLLTVGYGDIYPITTAGKIVSIFITFLGVGMVAIPTGIISAGFVDQFSRIKRLSEYAGEQDIQFIKIQLQKRDSWVGKAIKDLELPHDMIIAMIRRGREQLIPGGDVVLKDNDILVLGASAMKDGKHIDLKEIVLRKQNPWNGRLISELDISRQTIIVMIKRNGTMLIPKGDLMLLEGDHVILYSQSYIADAEQIII
jgi:voltage-gated potassium channel